MHVHGSVRIEEGDEFMGGNRSMKEGESPRERVHGSIQGIHVCICK